MKNCSVQEHSAYFSPPVIVLARFTLQGVETRNTCSKLTGLSGRDDCSVENKALKLDIAELCAGVTPSCARVRNTKAP
ncbi:hypothetical protein O3P69_008458 [Scylla paramamosain]|uniref:Uncharacterized protein n=1 Tax=Scylla paramamosain TaxID=85552 RepID=A0AAW0SLQ4_SCYPA